MAGCYRAGHSYAELSLYLFTAWLDAIEQDSLMLNSVYTYSQHGWMLEQDPEQLASRLLFILTFSAAIPVTTNLFKELNKGKTLGIF